MAADVKRSEVSVAFGTGYNEVCWREEKTIDDHTFERTEKCLYDVNKDGYPDSYAFNPHSDQKNRVCPYPEYSGHHLM